MQAKLSGYLQVLADANPASVGGCAPGKRLLLRQQVIPTICAAAGTVPAAASSVRGGCIHGQAKTAARPRVGGDFLAAGVAAGAAMALRAAYPHGALLLRLARGRGEAAVRSLLGRLTSWRAVAASARRTFWAAFSSRARLRWCSRRSRRGCAAWRSCWCRSSRPSRPCRWRRSSSSPSSGSSSRLSDALHLGSDGIPARLSQYVSEGIRRTDGQLLEMARVLPRAAFAAAGGDLSCRRCCPTSAPP